jgi:hypothetical protein
MLPLQRRNEKLNEVPRHHPREQKVEQNNGNENYNQVDYSLRQVSLRIFSSDRPQRFQLHAGTTEWAVAADLSFAEIRALVTINSIGPTLKDTSRR